MTRRSPGGRPSRLTPVIQQAVVEILRNTGCSRAQAARHIEVDPDTLYTWLNRKPEFRRAVEKAENEYDLGLLARARVHATRDARTATWLIERHPRLRAEWAPKAELALVGPDGQVPQVEVKHEHGLAPGAANPLTQLAQLAATLDVLVRVGVVPEPLGSEPRLVGPSASGNAEDDEVHPA